MTPPRYDAPWSKCSCFLPLLPPGRVLRAAEPAKGAGKGTITIYAWGGGDGRREIV